MKRDKLLIITLQPFGSLVDSYKWCEYLKDDYDITYFCFESTSGNKHKLTGINYKEISYKGNRTVRGIRFIFHACLSIVTFKGKILVEYFPQCVFLKRIFPFKKMLLDVRTLSVSENNDIRKKQDQEIFKACSMYDYVTVISEGVRNKLNLQSQKIDILPLGADVISKKHKDYSSIKLLYVGTLHGRNIDQTIEGVALFINEHPSQKITYDIVGDGLGNELQICKDLVRERHLETIVKFHGHVSHEELSPFFDKCNIGVSYIPITDYYNYQPPTKTYEYIFSGLYTIATATEANKEIINSSNGIIIKDTAQEFSQAILTIFINKDNIDERAIRNSLLKYSWKNIINNILKPILDSIR